MADRDLAIRLSVKDADTVKRALTLLGEDGQKALARIEDAATPASKNLLALNKASSDVRGEMENFAGRLGVFGGVMTSLGTAGLVTAAGIAAVGGALAVGAKEFGEDEVSFRRLEAVLRSTGSASGVTAREIAEIGEKMELTTFATNKGVLDSVAALATFRSISGDTFRQALTLSQDMAAVFGGDMRASAVQLGKALEDPITGLTSLRRVGVTFSETQKDMITKMTEAGDVASAQKVILAALQGQLGGAGVGEATGLIGAADHATKSWSNLLKALSETAGVGGTATAVLEGIGKGLQGWADYLAPMDEFAIKSQKLMELQQRIADMEKSGRGDFASALRQQAAQLSKEIDDLVARGQYAAKKIADEKAEAEKGAADALAERNADSMSTRLKKLEEDRVKAASEAADKIAAIENQLSLDVAAAQKKVGTPGISDADVEKEVSLLQDIAARKIAAIQKPLIEAQQRQADADAKVLADLQTKLAAAASPRDSYIAEAVARLSKSATPATRQQTADLAGDMYDQKQALVDLNKEMEAHAKALEKASQLTLQYGTAEDAYAERIREINALRNEGVLSEQTYARAMEDAEKRKLAASKETSDGIQRALIAYAKKSEDSASVAERVTTDAFTSMEDAAAKFATTGKITFGDFTNSVVADLARIATRAVTSPIASYLSSTSFASTIASLFHGGGNIADGSPLSRPVDPLAFVGAKRLHSGGFAANEVPIVALKSERVLTEAQQDNTAATISGLAAMASQRGGTSLTVNPTVYNSAPNTNATVKSSWGNDGSLNIDVFVETVEAKMSRNIRRGEGIAPTLEQTYGISRVGN